MNRKERTILITIIINGLLIIFKYWLANASNSQALQASAVHSVTDTIIGVFILIGLFISRWNATRQGVKQGVSIIESWIALFIAAAIFYVAYDIVREVLMGETPELNSLGPIVLASLITVAVAYFIARYKIYVGRQTDSLALIASGAHSQMDIYASIMVVIGLAGSALGLPNLDRAAAAVVVVFILLSGYEIAASAIKALRHHEVLDIEGESGQYHVQPTSRARHAVTPGIISLLAIFYLVSGIYTVQPGEAAVVRRFGQIIIENAGPGLHYRLPWPVDQVDIVNVDTIRRSELPASLMVTGDESLVSIRLSLHYAVTDPSSFLLNVVDPEVLTSQAAEAAMRQVVAEEGVDALLTVDKFNIQARAVTLAQTILDDYGAGVRVTGVQLLESNPPQPVADAFRDVASAGEDRNTFINEAQAYRNEILPLARGDAETTIQAARAYAFEKTRQASGDAALFTGRQSAYARAPEITRQRLYLEAVESVLENVRKLVVDSRIRLETTDLWLTGEGGTPPFLVQP